MSAHLLGGGAPSEPVRGGGTQAPFPELSLGQTCLSFLPLKCWKPRQSLGRKMYVIPQVPGGGGRRLLCAWGPQRHTTSQLVGTGGEQRGGTHGQGLPGSGVCPEISLGCSRASRESRMWRPGLAWRWRIDALSCEPGSDREPGGRLWTKNSAWSVLVSLEASPDVQPWTRSGARRPAHGCDLRTSYGRKSTATSTPHTDTKGKKREKRSLFFPCDANSGLTLLTLVDNPQE